MCFVFTAYSPLAASGHDEILLFWAGNCSENVSGIVGFYSNYKKNIKQNYNYLAKKNRIKCI